MTKRLQPILVVVIALLVPSLVYAGADKLWMTMAHSEGGLVVSVHASNTHPLAGIDIPLRYSEGVTLEKVTFDGTRTEYFDFKHAQIVEADRTVVLGFLPQFGPDSKPDLAVGEGTICQLHFRVDDESASKLSIEAIELKKPDHSTMFIRRDGDQVVADVPEFSTVAFSLGNDAVPTQFGLHQNYPNPFNPTTNLAFDLPTNCHVRLQVFNVLGQRVATLVDQEMDAGSHVVTFNGDKVSSGVYFYRLEAGDLFSKTQKMMLLK